jgi:hypothetical protein
MSPGQVSRRTQIGPEAAGVHMGKRADASKKERERRRDAHFLFARTFCCFDWNLRIIGKGLIPLKFLRSTLTSIFPAWHDLEGSSEP